MASAFGWAQSKLDSIIFVSFLRYRSLFEQMIQAQQVRDRKIFDLVTAMEETYSLAISVNELKNDERLQDIINQILRQTIECGYFIQEYTRRNFGGMWQPLLVEGQ